jgi:hypothetical protein
VVEPDVGALLVGGLRGYTRAHCYYSLKFLATIGVLHTNENKGGRMTKYPRLSRAILVGCVRRRGGLAPAAHAIAPAPAEGPLHRRAVLARILLLRTVTG